jgi:hypothetical protein
MNFSHPIPLSFFATLAFSSNVVFSQPPPMPEQDYSVDILIERPTGCASTDRPPVFSNYYIEALECGYSHDGFLAGYDKAVAGCFEDTFWSKVRPYRLECEYTFDTNTDFSTTNHSVTCTSIKRVDQDKVDQFALVFGKTFKYAPPIVDGKMQVVKGHKQSFNFVCE